MEVKKWLRQQTRDFYTTGFDGWVKWWNKCINVNGGYVKKYVFSRFEHQMFYVLYPFATYLLTFPHTIDCIFTIRLDGEGLNIKCGRLSLVFPSTVSGEREDDWILGLMFIIFRPSGTSFKHHVMAD
jgi:hypothetical protein